MKQLFKKDPDYDLLKVILDDYCKKEKNYYVIDYVTYKKIIYNNFQDEWLELFKDYYHQSKYFYIERKFTYQSFMNIIKQLCKFFKIKYNSILDKNQNYKNLLYKIYFF